jgi:hypothetical protein
MEELEKKIEKAIDMIVSYGDDSNAHHKQWVLTQVLKILMGEYDYEVFKTELDRIDYSWDEGVAP